MYIRIGRVVLKPIPTQNRKIWRARPETQAHDQDYTYLITGNYSNICKLKKCKQYKLQSLGKQMLMAEKRKMINSMA